MTVSLSWLEYLDQFKASDQKELQFDPTDKQDMTRQYTGQLVEGWMRWIYLRDGIRLLVEKTQNRDQLTLEVPETVWWLTWNFILSGKRIDIDFPSCKKADFSINKGSFFLHGSGFINRYTYDFAHTGPFFFVTIYVRPDVLRSFIGDVSEDLPQVFKHLIRPNDRPCYKRAGKTSPIMDALLQQILQCSDKGVTKRMYIEGKVLELLSLLIKEEADIHEGDAQASVLDLDYRDLDYRDRVHYAKEILAKNLTSPPSLAELSHLVGLCDSNLKRGFKEVFDTTVFSYLRDRRLERAQQLLLEPQMKVAEVARTVGYESRTSFATAFKQKYGVSPNAYKTSFRK